MLFPATTARQDDDDDASIHCDIEDDNLLEWCGLVNEIVFLDQTSWKWMNSMSKVCWCGHSSPPLYWTTFSEYSRVSFSKRKLRSKERVSTRKKGRKWQTPPKCQAWAMGWWQPTGGGQPHWACFESPYKIERASRCLELIRQTHI
jgi:hypothetical protein